MTALLDNREERIGRALIVGLCGGLEPTLKSASVISPAEVLDDVTGRVLWPEDARRGSGRLLTRDHLVTTPSEKAAIHRRSGAVAVDMETAAAAAVCANRGVAWTCRRAVGDTAEQELPAHLNAWIDEEGRPRYAAIAGALLRRPAYIRELRELRRQTAAAARSLADEIVSLLAGYR